MLTIWPVNSTPWSCNQAIVAADSSTIARTKRAFAFQWLYSMMLLNASSRL